MPKTLASTRHFKLAQDLRLQIRKMKVGEALPTVLELREMHGCSQATVERALDRLRREGLISRPAGQLRLTVAEASDPATYRVSIIRPDYPSTTFEELSRAIIDAGKKRNWAFDLQTYRSLEGLSINNTLGDADGGVLLPTSEQFPAHLMNALKRPHRPIVIIQDPPPGLRVSSVRMDDGEIGQLAVRHLASCGHKRVLCALSEPSCPSHRARVAGWRREMETIGQTDLDELVVDPALKPFDNSMLKTYEYFAGWLKRPHPKYTAIFCPAWTGAAAVLRALREQNIKVPEEVSVIAQGGEGDISAFLFPALTAVETDLVQYGQVVADVLEKQLKNADEVEHRIIHSTLALRDSITSI